MNFPFVRIRTRPAAALRPRLAWLIWLWSSASLFAAPSALQYNGIHHFSREQLDAALVEQTGEIASKGLTTARADDAAFLLASFYRRNGYARVGVTYTIQGSTLTLNVQEGPFAVIRSAQFVGNEHHTAAELSQFLVGVAPDQIAAQKFPYNVSEIGAGIDRIRGFYLSEGWLDADVRLNDQSLSADGTAAHLVIAIVEGTQYKIGDVTFHFPGNYSVAELRKGLGTDPSGVFTPFKIDAMHRSLESWLRERGHFAATVTVEADKAQAVDGVVPVMFTVAPGAKFRVTRVDTRGLDRVTPRFLENRFNRVTGQLYSPEKIDEKYRELIKTGLFRSLRITPTPESEDTLRLDITADEAKQKEFGFEFGYGTYDGLTAGIRVGDLNFLRHGRPLSIRLESSQRGFRGELIYTDPWLLETDWTLKTRLYSEVRQEQGYDKTGEGLRLDLSRKLRPRWEVSAFAGISDTSVSSTQIDPALLGPTQYILTSGGLAQTLDYRDEPLNPRRGWINTDSVELDSIDGSPSFIRITTRFSQYHPIGRSVLAFGIRTGWIIPLTGSESVPIDLRYFNGGGSTVRSFAERELGPKDKGGDPVGGEFFTVANLELDFPITDVIGGAVFADAGNLTLGSSANLDDPRFAIGLGFRYLLPIGPLRLDYGFNPAPKNDEAIGAFHLSFGFAF